MEQEYTPSGERLRSFRPYIFAEETTWNTSLYDPFRSVNYGMYDWPIPPPALTNPQDVSLYQNKLFRSPPADQPATGRGLIPLNRLTEHQRLLMTQGAIPPIYMSDFDKQEGPYRLYGLGFGGQSGYGGMKGGSNRYGYYKRLYAV